MEIYIVLATAFILGAVLSFLYSKAAFEKQLQKTKANSDKEVEDLYINNILLQQRLTLTSRQYENLQKELVSTPAVY